VSTYALQEGVRHTFTVDAQPWAIRNDTKLDFDYEVCLDLAFPRSYNSFCHSGSIIDLLLERVNLKSQLLLSESSDERQIPLTCVPHFLE
jgi:hypothetical protein